MPSANLKKCVTLKDTQATSYYNAAHQSANPSVPTEFRQACRFLRRNDKIAALLAVIERNVKLLGDIRSALPAPLDEHCLHASLDAGVLTLVTDSPVWSSRLRFFAPELENALAARHGPISGYRIRIQPHALASSSDSGSNSRNRLSARTAQHLVEAAAGIEDAQVAAALRRLAKAGADNR